MKIMVPASKRSLRPFLPGYLIFLGSENLFPFVVTFYDFLDVIELLRYRIKDENHGIFLPAGFRTLKESFWPVQAKKCGIGISDLLLHQEGSNDKSP